MLWACGGGGGWDTERLRRVPLVDAAAVLSLRQLGSPRRPVAADAWRHCGMTSAPAPKGKESSRDASGHFECTPVAPGAAGQPGLTDGSLP